ncbi:MAG: hypothetical protein IT190_06280 [Microbacteriaceae bacterium]|nr:hypothetical protein [Microbacteriaceae bacterium]
MGVLGVAGVSALLLLRSKSDEEMSAALVGTWRAEDPSNAALHRRQGPVESEEIRFAADGTLQYRVKAQNKDETPQEESWAWKVMKGRLIVRFVTGSGVQDWERPLPFSVSTTQLSIERKGYPSKQFVRVKP